MPWLRLASSLMLQAWWEAFDVAVEKLADDAGFAAMESAGQRAREHLEERIVEHRNARRFVHP